MKSQGAQASGPRRAAAELGSESETDTGFTAGLESP